MKIRKYFFFWGVIHLLLWTIWPAGAHAQILSWTNFKSNLQVNGWVEGDDVTISHGTTVLYDGHNELIGRLFVLGEFKCVNAVEQVSLITTGVAVMETGLFQCGTELEPYVQNFTLIMKEGAQFTGGESGDLTCMEHGVNDQSFVVACGGSLVLHGDHGHNTWTQLEQTASSTSGLNINVINALGWNVDDEIVFAAGEFSEDVFNRDLIQRRVITAKAENTLSLNSPLEYRVIGGYQPYLYNTNNALVYEYGDIDIAGTLANHYQQKLVDSYSIPLLDQTGNSLLDRILSKNNLPLNAVDERTEVANLSRNIKFIGDPDTVIQKSGFHMMFMHGPGDIKIDSIEIFNGGRAGELGRYPIHWHMTGDREGDYVRNSSIHDSYNRCVTIHQTDNVTIEKNVCVNTIGSAYFLEDGNEVGNRFIDNIAILVIPPSSDEVLIQADIMFRESVGKISGPAGFWIANPDNIFIGNSASSSGSGYWFAFKDSEHSVAGTPAPDMTPFSVFSGNRVHNTVDGVLIEGRPIGDCANNLRNPCTDERSGDRLMLLGQAYYTLAGSEGMIVLDDITSYKNVEFGVWAKMDDMTTLTHLILADTAVADLGVVLNQRVYNSLIVGATPDLLPHEKFSKSGILLYDGPATYEKIHFAGFDGLMTQPISLFGAAANRPQHFAGGISYADPSISLLNFAHDLSFRPKRRENWSTGLYIQDNTFGDHPDFGAYSIRPDEPSSKDDISVFFSVSPEEIDCKNSEEWHFTTGLDLTSASVCPGHFGAIRFYQSMDALFTRKTFNTNYPDVEFDHRTSNFGWGPLSNFSYPNALIKANQGVLPPSDVNDLTYEISFLNPTEFALVNDDLNLMGGDRFYSFVIRLVYQDEWSPWFVFNPVEYTSCILSQEGNSHLFVSQPDDINRILRFRFQATIPDVDYDKNGERSLFVYDGSINILCGPDTDEDGILNSYTNDDDGDGILDDLDEDDDNDGVNDDVDFYPQDPSGFRDTDGDGVGDNYDLDDDGDGMSDVWEASYSGLDPLVDDGGGDLDYDGLSNSLEYFLSQREGVVHPNQADSDGDGASDGFEWYSLLNPFQAGSASPDSDGDGFTDLEEQSWGNDPLSYVDPPRVNVTQGLICSHDSPNFTLDYYWPVQQRCWKVSDGTIPNQIGAFPLENPTSVDWFTGFQDTEGEAWCLANRNILVAGDWGGINWEKGLIACHFNGSENFNPNRVNMIKQLESGPDYFCGVGDGDDLFCFDKNESEISVPALVGIKYLAVGENVACVVDESDLHCWDKYSSSPPSSSIILNKPSPFMPLPGSLAIGVHHACSLDESGVRCWGDNTVGQLGIDDSPFDGYIDGMEGARAIAAGDYHTCGIKNDWSLQCWGDNSALQTNLPSQLNDEIITSLSIDGNTSCVIRAGYDNALNAVVCWPLQLHLLDYDNDGWSDVTETTCGTIMTDPLNVPADTDNDTICNQMDWDDDGDGVPDLVDAEPLNIESTTEVNLPINRQFKGGRNSAGL